MFSDGSLAIGICDRCQQKRPYNKLCADGNSPALRVCSDRDCRDVKDPWRLSPVAPDAMVPQRVRPDVSLSQAAPLTFIRWDIPGLTWDSGLTWDQEV